MRKVNNDLPVAAAIKDMTTIQRAITHGLYPDFGFIPTAIDGSDTDETKRLETLFIPAYLSLDWDLDPEFEGSEKEKGRERLKTIKHIMPFLYPGNKFTSEGWKGPYLKPDTILDATYFDEKRFPEGDEGEHVYMRAMLTPWAEKCEEMAIEAEANGDKELAKKYMHGRYYHLLGRPIKDEGKCIEWGKDAHGNDICIKWLWKVPPPQACVVCQGQDGLGQTGAVYEICEKKCRDAGEIECEYQDRQCQGDCNRSYKWCMNDYQTCLLEVSACRESYETCMGDYDTCFEDCKNDPDTGYQDCVNNNCRSLEECCDAKVYEFCQEICRWNVNCGNVVPKPDDPDCHERCAAACAECGDLTCSECNEGSYLNKCKKCSEANSPHPDGVGWYLLKYYKWGTIKYRHYGRGGSRWSRKYAFCGPCNRSVCVETGKLYTFRQKPRYVYYDCGDEIDRCPDACRDQHCSHCKDKLDECSDIESGCNNRERECPRILAGCAPDRNECMKVCSEAKEQCLKRMPIICEGKCMQNIKITNPADPSYLDTGDDLVMFVFSKYIRLPVEKGKSSK